MIIAQTCYIIDWEGDLGGVIINGHIYEFLSTEVGKCVSLGQEQCLVFTTAPEKDALEYIGHDAEIRHGVWINMRDKKFWNIALPIECQLTSCYIGGQIFVYSSEDVTFDEIICSLSRQYKDEIFTDIL